MEPLHNGLRRVRTSGLAFEGIAVIDVPEVFPQRVERSAAGTVGGVFGQQQVEVAGVVVPLPAAAAALEGTRPLVPDKGFADDAATEAGPAGAGGRSRTPHGSGRNARR